MQFHVLTLFFSYESYLWIRKTHNFTCLTKFQLWIDVQGFNLYERLVIIGRQSCCRRVKQPKLSFVEMDLWLLWLGVLAISLQHVWSQALFIPNCQSLYSSMTLHCEETNSKHWNAIHELPLISCIDGSVLRYDPPKFTCKMASIFNLCEKSCYLTYHILKSHGWEQYSCKKERKMY